MNLSKNSSLTSFLIFGSFFPSNSQVNLSKFAKNWKEKMSQKTKKSEQIAISG